MKRALRGMAALLCLLLLLPLTGCSAPEMHTRNFYTYMDTVSTVLGGGSDAEFDAACAIVEGILSDYTALCDIYTEYSGINNARTLNLAAGKEPVAVDARLLDVLAYGIEMYGKTDGKCNIAMGSVLRLWHDCREEALSGGEARLPSEKDLRAAAEHCDINDLILDREAGTAFLRDGEMQIDLGAVAKGYATEEAARALKDAGFDHYALSIGGNIRTVGTKENGTAWITGIQEPQEDSAAYRLRVRTEDTALVTSGSYQRYYEVDGVRYHHIIDPDTLFPKNEFLSVTILTGDSSLGDALSTAVFNMPLKDGLDYVNHFPGVEACWILADGSEVYSDGFEANIAK